MKRKGRKHQPKVGTQPERTTPSTQDRAGGAGEHGVGGRGAMFWIAIVVIVALVVGGRRRPRRCCSSALAPRPAPSGRSGAERAQWRRPSCSSLPSTSAGATSRSASVTTSPSRLTPALDDLAAPFLVRRDRLWERPGDQGGHPDPPVTHVAGAGSCTSGTSSGTSWATNTRSNSASAAAPAPSPWYRSTTVRASSRFASTGCELAVCSRRVTSSARSSDHRSRARSTAASARRAVTSACRTARAGDSAMPRSSRATSTSSARRRARRGAAW